MRRFLARLALSIALILIAVLAAVMAAGFFFVALYLWLKTFFIPPVAAAVCGLMLLAVAGILVLIAQVIMRRRRRRLGEDISAEAGENAALIGSILGRKAHRFAQTQSAATLVGALVAGFAVGLSPKLREILLSLLKI